MKQLAMLRAHSSSGLGPEEKPTLLDRARQRLAASMEVDRY
jgi:hypothetical protein